MAASKDKTRAILSYSSPNPVGPYKLVTPINQIQPQQTKTPILPVMGGKLINTMPPPLPTRQTTPVAPPLPERLVNVPAQQSRIENKSTDSWVDVQMGSYTGIMSEAQGAKTIGFAKDIAPKISYDSVIAITSMGSSGLSGKQKVKIIRGLSPAEQETLAALAPEWTGDFKEIIDVARSLSK